MAKIKNETLSKTNYKIMQKTFNDSPGRFSIMVPPTRYLRSHSQAILVLGKACFLSCLFLSALHGGWWGRESLCDGSIDKAPLSLSLSFSPSFGGLQKPLFTPLPLCLGANGRARRALNVWMGDLVLAPEYFHTQAWMHVFSSSTTHFSINLNKDISTRQNNTRL